MRRRVDEYRCRTREASGQNGRRDAQGRRSGARGIPRWPHAEKSTAQAQLTDERCDCPEQSGLNRPTQANYTKPEPCAERVRAR